MIAKEKYYNDRTKTQQKDCCEYFMNNLWQEPAQRKESDIDVNTLNKFYSTIADEDSLSYLYDTSIPASFQFNLFEAWEIIETLW